MEQKKKDKIAVIALIFALLALSQAEAITNFSINLIAGSGINISRSGDNYTISATGTGSDNTKINKTGDITVSPFYLYSQNIYDFILLTNQSASLYSVPPNINNVIKVGDKIYLDSRNYYDENESYIEVSPTNINISSNNILIKSDLNLEDHNITNCANCANKSILHIEQWLIQNTGFKNITLTQKIRPLTSEVYLNGTKLYNYIDYIENITVNSINIKRTISIDNMIEVKYVEN